MRSRRSAAPSIGVDGISTAPSFIVARMVSHSSTWLASMRMIRSPRATPWERSQFATRFDRRVISANEYFPSVPSCSTIHSAGRSAEAGSAPIASKCSSAQLNSSSSGQVKSRRAAS